MKDKILEELNALVEKRGHEVYILSRLKHLKWDKLGKKNIQNLIECFTEKDAKTNKRLGIKTNPSQPEWFNGNYECFMDFFSRSLTEEKMNSIMDGIKKSQVIVPNECNIESIGSVGDTSSIIRLKKTAKDVASDLKELGVPENYTFVNMKLLVSYYHNIHAPVSGKIVRMIPVPRELNFFGKNALWILEFETKKDPVFLLLVGESAIQDFNFTVKEGQKVKMADKLGNFMWGSQTVLLFNKDSYPSEIQINKKNNYFLGQTIV
jgi:phosphatidylserine decarboxylase